jgi:hypothetical protein
LLSLLPKPGTFTLSHILPSSAVMVSRTAGTFADRAVPLNRKRQSNTAAVHRENILTTSFVLPCSIKTNLLYN